MLGERAHQALTDAGLAGLGMNSEAPKGGPLLGIVEERLWSMPVTVPTISPVTSSSATK